MASRPPPGPLPMAPAPGLLRPLALALPGRPGAGAPAALLLLPPPPPGILYLSAAISALSFWLLTLFLLSPRRHRLVLQRRALASASAPSSPAHEAAGAVSMGLLAQGSRRSLFTPGIQNS